MKTGRGEAREAVGRRGGTAGTVGEARAYALRLLAFSDRTVRELEGKIRRKGFAEGVVTEVLEEMKSLGYLDDERYARHFADTRAASRGFGPVRIRIELERRGIARELAEGAAAKVFEGANEYEAALGVARHWATRGGVGDDVAARRRLYAFLARRGFSPDVAHRALREVLG